MVLRQVACLALLLACGHAWAADTTAKQYFERGSAFYDIGQYRDAAREYEEAYKLKNDPALLFNIGQAYRLGGDAQGALRAYKSYLRRSPDATNRAVVESYIQKLQKQLEEPPPPAPPPPAPSPPPPVVIVTREAPAKTPPYKKWWLWTIVGGVAVVGVGVGLAVAYTTPNDAPAPPDAFTVTFR